MKSRRHQAHFKWKILWHDLNCLRWNWFRTKLKTHFFYFRKHLSVPLDASTDECISIKIGMTSLYSPMRTINSSVHSADSARCRNWCKNQNQFKWIEEDTRWMHIKSLYLCMVHTHSPVDETDAFCRVPLQFLFSFLFFLVALLPRIFRIYCFQASSSGCDCYFAVALNANCWIRW